MDKTITATENILLSDDVLNAVKKAMKIGFYKSFYNKGIINASQFEKLLQMQAEEKIIISHSASPAT